MKKCLSEMRCILTVALLFFLMSACASKEIGPYQYYPGEALPFSEVAILKTAPSDLGDATTFIKKIDGGGNFRGQSWDATVEIAILPGPHILDVADRSGRMSVININAEAGHTYVLVATTNRSGSQTIEVKDLGKLIRPPLKN